ncbi:serine protease [Streptomyces sp. TLI_185]|uniref:S1 family peptidase n=1 Tax=Streptomyces sp. TLI_185 TaxID=2485151 RepID=UPI000F4E6980|nr:serine protease [Streptomyces sp. TLI_185]RPF39300.1 trypsin-like peptidase [Streptomyces sp. TLI_185]
MSTMSYWVQIDEGDLHLGAGFLVTRGFVLTALHCMEGVSSYDADLDLQLPDGQRVPGRLCDRIEDADLALISVVNAHAYDLPVAPPTDRPRQDIPWKGSYRPPGEKTRLSGQITHAPVSHQSEAGGEFTGLQLTVDQEVHNFAGYSGSPVDIDSAEAGSRERPVVGILMEQELSRADGSPDTNVVFAASVLHAIERFPYFDVAHLRAAVAGEQLVLPAQQPRRAVPDSGVEAFLRRLRQLEEDGYITPQEAADGRAKALRALGDQLLGGAGGD